MLCPEVFNFEPRSSAFQIEKGKLAEYSNCTKTISTFYNNHLVYVILPGGNSNEQSLADSLLDDCDYYKISNISVGEFVAKKFINNFIKKGSFTALTLGQRIDCDDCICVTPEGVIVLSLTKDTYESSGFEGKISHFHNKTNSRYIVHVDVLKDYFKPGKANYEKTLASLNKLGKFTFVMYWDPPTDDVCPSSVAKYFHSLNYKVKLCTPPLTMRTDRFVNVPDFREVDPHEFTEWLGLYAVGADVKTGNSDSYVNCYETPEPSTRWDTVRFMMWQGFFSCKEIDRLFTQLVDYVKTKNIEWISLHVQGFSDSPINWHLNEHTYFDSGDNSYTITFNSERFMLYKQMSSNKRFK